MLITVSVTTADLADMQITKQQLEQGITSLVDGGIEIKHEEKVYFNDFRVGVHVAD